MTAELGENPKITYELHLKRMDGSTLELPVRIGEQLFVLGPNGSGKSGLMSRFYNVAPSRAKRILAQRQVWMNTNASMLSPAQRIATNQNLTNDYMGEHSRYLDRYAEPRISMALYDLLAAEQTRAQKIASLVEQGKLEEAEKCAKIEAPLKHLSNLLAQSNIPIRIVHEDDQFLAKKANSSYGISRLSDGERNALLLASEVLTAKPDSLILIDEPERHLHRSIISPLLRELFASRADCAFVISTHAIELVTDSKDSKVLLLRGCEFEGDVAGKWDADLIRNSEQIAESFRKDILGSRRKILFVEGNDASLDRQLYSILFPQISIVAKESCKNVEQSVTGIRGSQELHWINAFGIIDGDGRSAEDKQALKSRGIYALSAYSIESLYYHANIRQMLAERQAHVSGEDPVEKAATATAKGLKAVSENYERLCVKVAQATCRAEATEKTQRLVGGDITSKLTMEVDAPAILAAERRRAETLLVSRDFEGLLARYPLRESPALDLISKELCFPNTAAYERAVRKLLSDGGAPLQGLRSLFDGLPAELGIAL